MGRRLWRGVFWLCLATGLADRQAAAQTRVNLNTQGRSADFGSFQGSVRPWRVGAALPETCSQGEAFFRTDQPAGQNLYFCQPGNSWKATSYDPGAGIVLSDNLIQVEDAVIPTYRTGHGAPAGPCSPGRDFHLNLDTQDLYFCSGEDTWSNLKQGPHAHSASDVTSGVLPAARGGTGFAAAESSSVLVGDGTGWVKTQLPNCADGASAKLLYQAGTRSFVCGTDQGAGGSTREVIWIPVMSSSSSSTYPNQWIIPSTGGPSVSRIGTAPFQFGTMVFADGSDLSASTMIGLRPDYQSNATITVFWYASTNNTNVVRWSVFTSCAGPGVAIPAAERPAVSADAAHNGTSSGLNKTTLNLDMTGCNAGDLLTIRLMREATHAADTMTFNAAMLGAQIAYQRGL